MVKFFINWAIYFALISLFIGFFTMITGGAIHGFLPVRFLITAVLAYLKPIIKNDIN